MNEVSPADFRDQRCKDPCTMVIFGASGDLTRRKLVPALYSLLLDGLLPERFAVVGVARSDLTDRAFVDSLREGLAQHSRRAFDEERWSWLAERMRYVRVTDEAEGYPRLETLLRETEDRHGTDGNRLYYLATPPRRSAPRSTACGRRACTAPAARAAGRASSSRSRSGATCAPRRSSTAP